jgi:hypothetical protein
VAVVELDVGRALHCQGARDLEVHLLVVAVARTAASAAAGNGRRELLDLRREGHRAAAEGLAGRRQVLPMRD